MFNEKVTFENIPKQVLWDNGNIIQPVLMYYELQRLNIINAKRYLCVNSNYYGIKKLILANDLIANNIFQIQQIECIFSDGTIFKKSYTSEKCLSISIENIKARFNEEVYIFIIIPEYSSKNFILGKNDSRYKESNVDSINETENDVIFFRTLEENVSLYIGTHPPVNYAYIPLAKILNEEGNPHFVDYIPPSLNIKSSEKLQLIAQNLNEFMRKKLEILKQDIDFIKNSENILSFIEKNQLNIFLKQAITNIQTTLSIQSCTPEMLYNEYLSTLSLLTTTSMCEDNIENVFYQPENINYIFENIISRIEFILNHEISEKYRTFRFSKKENIFFINLNFKLPENIKITVKKPFNIKEEEIIEWVKTALICEKADMDFNIEKRCIGFDRKIELINQQMFIKNDFLLFSVNISNAEIKNENTIIITQNINNLSKFEPDEIYLYQEKVT